MNVGDVSVIVTSFNEEDNISRCLERLDGFGEILLIDSFSTDETLSIARTHGAVIFSRPRESAARQRKWALRAARNDWVLVLDADETVTDELRSGIDEFNESSGISGFWIRRENYYLDGPIHHCGWRGDEVLRFFDRRKGTYDEVSVREKINIRGRASTLTGVLRHYRYRSVERHLDEIDRHSTRDANDYAGGGGRLPVMNGFLRQPFRFFWMYVMQRGFLDGRRGFLLCLLSSYDVFLKYAKAWELLRGRPKT